MFFVKKDFKANNYDLRLYDMRLLLTKVKRSFLRVFDKNQKKNITPVLI
jgi:hypothetical protein